MQPARQPASTAAKNRLPDYGGVGDQATEFAANPKPASATAKARLTQAPIAKAVMRRLLVTCARDARDAMMRGGAACGVPPLRSMPRKALDPHPPNGRLISAYGNYV